MELCGELVKLKEEHVTLTADLNAKITLTDLDGYRNLAVTLYTGEPDSEDMVPQSFSVFSQNELVVSENTNYLLIESKADTEDDHTLLFNNNGMNYFVNNKAYEVILSIK